MLSIPEIAKELVDITLNEYNDDNSRTIFIVGSKSAGKSTLINLFLDKTDTPRETLVLEYSFGRKSNQKQAIEKIICHVWEYGGKLDIFKSIIPSIPIKGKHYFCVMIDLSKIKTIWNTIEICLQAFSECENAPELMFIGSKYDLFKNYDSEIKKLICTTLRSVALIHNAHLMYYSSKEANLAKRAKDILYNAGFGTLALFKEKNTNFTKPLMIPKGSDTWESIGVAASTMEQIKMRHLSRISPEAQPTETTKESERKPHISHPEPVLDTKTALLYEEIRHLPSLDITLDDYLIGLSN